MYMRWACRAAKVAEVMQDSGIGVGIHYPIPVHLQKAYAISDITPAISRSQKLANRFLSLPIYPELQPEQVAERRPGTRKCGLGSSRLVSI